MNQKIQEALLSALEDATSKEELDTLVSDFSDTYKEGLADQIKSNYERVADPVENETSLTLTELVALLKDNEELMDGVKALLNDTGVEEEKEAPTEVEVEVEVETEATEVEAEIVTDPASTVELETETEAVVEEVETTNETVTDETEVEAKDPTATLSTEETTRVVDTLLKSFEIEVNDTATTDDKLQLLLDSFNSNKDSKAHNYNQQPGFSKALRALYGR